MFYSSNGWIHFVASISFLWWAHGDNPNLYNWLQTIHSHFKSLISQEAQIEWQWKLKRISSSPGSQDSVKKWHQTTMNSTAATTLFSKVIWSVAWSKIKNKQKKSHSHSWVGYTPSLGATVGRCVGSKKKKVLFRDYETLSLHERILMQIPQQSWQRLL